MYLAGPWQGTKANRKWVKEFLAGTPVTARISEEGIELIDPLGAAGGGKGLDLSGVLHTGRGLEARSPGQFSWFAPCRVASNSSRGDARIGDNGK